MNDPLRDPEAFIATIARICELEQREIEAELLKNCTIELEQTDYDNWNGGTYIFSLYLQVTPERYAQVSSRLKSVEKIILEHSQALIRHNENDHINQVIIIPKVSAQPVIPRRPYRISATELVKDISAQRDLMISVATGGPRIQSVNVEYEDRRLRIGDGLDERKLDDPNPFGDLWAWYGKWSDGDLPTYQSRRQFISEMYTSLLRQIRTREPEGKSGREIEPTGWEKVDRSLYEVRRRLEAASTEEQFQAVGLLCRETLISVAQTVFNPQLHHTNDGATPSKTDAKRMLDAYISTTLTGRPNEVSRKHAKAALDLANELQHKRTASFRDTALCAEATTSVINLIAIISGERDPEKCT